MKKKFPAQLDLFSTNPQALGSGDLPLGFDGKVWAREESLRYLNGGKAPTEKDFLLLLTGGGKLNHFRSRFKKKI